MLAGLEALCSPPAASRPREPFTIGYLSAITPLKGLDLLAEAYLRFRSTYPGPAQLHVAGKILDPAFWGGVQSVLARGGRAAELTYAGEPDLAGKRSFLQGLSVYVQPSRTQEARGLSALEALATGVPVLAPASGAFPEMLEATGGGRCVPMADSGALAASLGALAADPEAADAMGQRAAAGIRLQYAPEASAREFLRLCAEIRATAG